MPIENLEPLLQRLAGASDLTQRLSVLEAVVEWWHGPVAADEGLSSEELGAVKLPMPLRWWYGRFGRRTNILSGQNWFMAPAQLWIESDAEEQGHQRLVFWQENQAVYLWSTATEGTDPPVWVRENMDGEPWEQEESPLSAFLIGMVLFEAIMHARSGASAAGIPQRRFKQLTSAMRPVPLAPWRWPSFPHRFYVRGNALMLAGPSMPDDDSRLEGAMLGAKVADELVFVRELDIDWDVIRY
jgi:hypothetical protein